MNVLKNLEFIYFKLCISFILLSAWLTITRHSLLHISLNKSSPAQILQNRVYHACIAHHVHLIKFVNSINQTTNHSGIFLRTTTMAKPTFNVVALVFQAILIVLFGVLVRYGDHAVPPHIREGTQLNSYAKLPSPNNVQINYSSKFCYLVFFSFSLLLQIFRSKTFILNTRLFTCF